MSVTISTTNKPLNPRAQDLSPKGYNRASLYSGKALDFDGVNDQVNITTSDVDFGANDFTVTAIANWTGSNADGKLAYAERGSANSQLAAWQIRTNGVGNMIFQTNTASAGWTEVSFSGVEAILNKGLTHLTFVRVGSSVTLYINGALYGSGSGIASTLDPANGNFCIGNRLGVSNYWNGLIGQYKIFNTALTAAQVSDLYLNPEKIVPDGVANSALKLWLPMMEGAGTTAYDGSGNGNHGTINGATWVSGVGAPVAQTALVGWNKGVNLLTNSESFDNAVWNKVQGGGVTVSANAETAPDGTNSADKVIETVTSGNHIIYQDVVVTSGITYTQTYFVKAAERTKAYILIQGSIGSGSAIFNTSNGTFSSASGATYSALQFSNNWWRISIVKQSIGTGAAAVKIGTVDASGSTSYAGDGTSGIYVWGAQLTATSDVQPYILTLATAQTSPVLLPQGLTANKDITNVNSVSRNAYALNLDGASWAEVHDNASLDFGTGDFTLEAWAKLKYVNTGSSINSILSIGTSASLTLIGMNSPSSIVGLIDGTGAYEAVTFDDWAHIVLTKEGTSCKLYLNAINTDTFSKAANITNTENKYIGGDVTSIRYYKDQIALPRIYNRALTATEVARNYNADKSKFGL